MPCTASGPDRAGPGRTRRRQARAPPPRPLRSHSSSSSLSLCCVVDNLAPAFRSHNAAVTSVLRADRVAIAIPDSPHRLDAGSRKPGPHELRTQPGHMDVDRARLDEAIAPPHRIQQLLAAEHATRGGGQDGEQLELLGGELDGPAFQPDLEALAVDLEVADLDVALALAAVPAAAPDDRPHARQELAWRERLGHVVVGAHLEAEDLVAFLDPAGHHDHGDRARLGILL